VEYYLCSGVLYVVIYDIVVLSPNSSTMTLGVLLFMIMTSEVKNNKDKFSFLSVF
jgi:hypothetical protein